MESSTTSAATSLDSIGTRTHPMDLRNLDRRVGVLEKKTEKHSSWLSKGIKRRWERLRRLSEPRADDSDSLSRASDRRAGVY